ITKDEMMAAGVPAGAQIINIQFNKLNTSLLSRKCHYSLYMGNSTNTGLPLGIPWADIMPYHTLVFSDSFNVSGSIGWETWNLTTPFSYNGDALEIAGEYVLVASA